MLVVLALSLVGACTWAWAGSAVRIPSAESTERVASSPIAVLAIDTTRPGDAFQPGAVGLSTEANALGTVYLNADHKRLARLMRLLGPSVLRIGGNNVDLSWWTSGGEPQPAWATNTVTPADLASLRKFLKATHWRVLLGVDLAHFDPSRVADEGRHARAILGGDLLGIEIGNEPDDFGKKPKLRPPAYSLGEYLQEAEAYRRVLDPTGVAIAGPAFARTEWLTQMGPAARMFGELTLHYYPTSPCIGAQASASNPPASELLSSSVRQEEEETVRALVQTGAAVARPTRIGETNAAPCRTSPASGPTFESALWALDWTLRAASHGVSGIDYHGGFGDCGPRTESPICAPGKQAAHSGDVRAQPEYYGLLAARQLEGGRFVPVHVASLVPLPNLTVWATLASDGTIKIAIDNLAPTGLAQPISIPTSNYKIAMEPLVGPSTAARTGVTLGGVRVDGNGRWRPRDKPLSARRSLQIDVPAASAVVIMLRPSSPHH